MHSNAGAAQKAIERGQAPKGIERVDKRTNLPNSQDEVEFKPKGSIQRDGTIKHPLGSRLTAAEKEWMTKWRFKIPPDGGH